MELLAADQLVLPAQPSSVREARHVVGRYAVLHGADESTQDAARLLVSETVTNALVHGCESSPGEVSLRMSVGGNRLRVEVGDDASTVPCRREVSPDDEGGRGLALLDTVATAWGCQPTGRGKNVWFELALS